MTDLRAAHVAYVKMLLATMIDDLTPVTANRGLKMIEDICRHQRNTLVVIDPASAPVEEDGNFGESDFSDNGSITIGTNSRMSRGRNPTRAPGEDLTSRMIEEGMAVFREGMGAQSTEKLTRALIEARKSGQADIVAALEQKFSAIVAPLRPVPQPTQPAVELEAK